jgi:hypothetical protein
MATFLGKAVVKTAMQSLFIIAIFSKDSLDMIMGILKSQSPRLYAVAQSVLTEQLQRYQSTPETVEVLCIYKGLIIRKIQWLESLGT